MLADLPLPLAAAALLVSFLIYRFVITPAFLSPLARLPAAHPTAHFSSLWILSHRLRQNDTRAVHDAHARLGPIVRLAPHEVSVNAVDGGIRTVYSGGFEKGDWYANVFDNYGVEPMFAMPERGRHGARKRMVSNIYAKSVLLGSAAAHAITQRVVGERLMARIRDEAAAGPVEFYNIFAAVTMDFVAAYVFGLRNGSDLLGDRAESVRFLKEYKARQAYTFWPQECPVTTRIFGRLGLRGLLVPRWVDAANASIEAWIMAMCDRAEAALEAPEKARDEDAPSVFVQLRAAMLKEHDLPKDARVMQTALRLEMASELLDHTLAGFDTSSITLTYLAWELSRPRNAVWQEALRAELAELPAASRLDAKALDGLPVLHAILMETLRMHAALPGQQPRVTPASGTTLLCGHAIPPRTRVSAQAWSLHRHPDVFPSPATFDPARWLPAGDPRCSVSAAQAKEMHRWFWAFSSGGRMCVGSNLAMLDMKATVAGIWRTFATEVLADERDAEEEDSRMRHNGGYSAEPLGDGQGAFCRLRVRELSA